MKSVLCIASSDSRAAAGLAVDLRACAALGVLGLPVVAALTAQGGGGARHCQPASAENFAAQLDAALSVPQLAALKIGLLAERSLVAPLAERLRACALPVLLDPVRASSSGQEFWSEHDWRQAMHALIPRATLCTPNLPELCALLEAQVADRDEELVAAARRLPLGEGGAVLIKGGHRAIDADDLLVTRETVRSFPGERLPGEFRGSGCALGAAIAALWARGRTLEESIEQARGFLRAAMQDAIARGEERLPHLFFEYYGSEGLP